MSEYLDKSLYRRVTVYDRNQQGVIIPYDNRNHLPFSGEDQLDNRILQVSKEVQYNLAKDNSDETRAINIYVLNDNGLPFFAVPKDGSQNLQCEKCSATSNVKEDCIVDPSQKWTVATGRSKKSSVNSHKKGLGRR